MSKFNKIIELIKLNNEKELIENIDADKSIVYQVNNDEWGIIHYCAMYGRTQILESLVTRYKVDINQLTTGEYTPAHIAARYSQLSCLKKMIELGADVTISDRGYKNTIEVLKEELPELFVKVGNIHDITVENLTDSISTYISAHSDTESLGNINLEDSI
jgi:ankyrin repeat protein